MGGAKILLSPVAIDNPARARNCARGEVAMLAQQGAQMLPFVLPVENSSAKKGRACAQCIGEAAGGARRVCGASNVKKNHDTLVECRKQKCVCAVQCVIRVSCGEQFTRHMLGVDAGRAVGSQSRAAQRVCQSRWCALSRRGRRWRACDFVGGRSFFVVTIKQTGFSTSIEN